MWKAGVKKFILDFLFPSFCAICQKEGDYLCPDCKATLEILEHQFCPVCQKIVADGKTCKNCKKITKLDSLFVALSYQNKLLQKMISQFKYAYIKELSIPLSSLIITHFQLLDNRPDFSDSLLVPVPLHKKKLRERGFNQAEEIAKQLAFFLKIPLICDALIKLKSSPPQVELTENERKENIKGVFQVGNSKIIRGQKILLVDDVYTTGATLNECARCLKASGAKEIQGIVVARG